ncbi:hypothetical protein Pelo_17070 [Pelomyxa schiedti]|nr:hypothetical protein Pelo_17070 [Pelomyxa schiedti]
MILRNIEASLLANLQNILEGTAECTDNPMVQRKAGQILALIKIKQGPEKRTSMQPSIALEVTGTRPQLTARKSVKDLETAVFSQHHQHQQQQPTTLWEPNLASHHAIPTGALWNPLPQPPPQPSLLYTPPPHSYTSPSPCPRPLAPASPPPPYTPTPTGSWGPSPLPAPRSPSSSPSPSMAAASLPACASSSLPVTRPAASAVGGPGPMTLRLITDLGGTPEGLMPLPLKYCTLREPPRTTAGLRAWLLAELSLPPEATIKVERAMAGMLGPRLLLNSDSALRWLKDGDIIFVSV